MFLGYRYNNNTTVWRHSEHNLPFLLFYKYVRMNFKNKLFAGFTAMALVVSTFAPILGNVAKADNAEDMAMYEWASILE